MRSTVLACAAAALAVACASAPPPDRTYSGRFSASTILGAERQNLSGRFTFEVRGVQSSLDLATPIGTTLARIEIGADGARVQTSSGEIRGADADALTERLLGWRLPVSGLADWIEGRPAPGRPAKVDRSGARVARIDQDGWVIRFSDFFGDGAQPRTLLLERPVSGSQPAVSLRLILDEPAASG